MKRILHTVVLAGFFMGASVLTSFAASEHEAHHPADKQVAATSSDKMMMQQGAGMGQMPCMAAASSGSKSPMMGMMGKGMGAMMGSGRSGMMGGDGMLGGDGMHGMMHGGQMDMMDMFYLDRADELGLSADQVSRLKAIHLEARKDNIRNAAEAKIARLELSDLLSGDNWALKDAEPLVRKVRTLEGDMHVRHLQAVSDARKVLTAEQLQQAQTVGSTGNLESLFQ